LPIAPAPFLFESVFEIIFPLFDFQHLRAIPVKCFSSLHPMANGKLLHFGGWGGANASSDVHILT
jgi:hypothetical protein